MLKPERLVSPNCLCIPRIDIQTKNSLPLGMLPGLVNDVIENLRRVFRRIVCRLPPETSLNGDIRDDAYGNPRIVPRGPLPIGNAERPVTNGLIVAVDVLFEQILRRLRQMHAPRNPHKRDRRSPTHQPSPGVLVRADAS